MRCLFLFVSVGGQFMDVKISINNAVYEEVQVSAEYLLTKSKIYS